MAMHTIKAVMVATLGNQYFFEFFTSMAVKAVPVHHRRFL